MACIITYENKQYSQKEFEQYFKEHFTEFVDNFLGSKQDVEGFKEFVGDKNNASKENNTIVGKVDIDYTIPIFENPNEFSDEFMNHC